MASLKETKEKPNINEFVLGKQIGEGNFSRIMLATHKATKEVFALKVIEKQRVKRLRIRHHNIFNEINMEKEVLNKLRHPNIIRLYHTFQDEGNLYFLLEYVKGGELLEHLVHEGRQIGLHEDLAQFYAADIVNAIEYIHANKVIHRDLKPENMVVSEDSGHLKLIDFGTAKDLDNTALNGPNFVGTPEYMSPETIDNTNVTYASDLWALGCIIYQLLTGETPYSGGSTYLTFLKVQDGSYHLPEYLSNNAKDLITKLLQKDPTHRLGAGEHGIQDLKAHPFFNGIDFENHMQAKAPTTKFQDESLFGLMQELDAAEKVRKKSQPLDFTADAVQTRIVSLSSQQRSLLMHLLKRKQLLHLPGIYPRFFSSPSLGRCKCASDGEYIGFTHGLQNQWGDNFSFVQLAGPKLGKEASLAENDSRGGSSWKVEANAFRVAITTINKRRPAFVVICGDFVNAKPDQEFHNAQVTAFQELVNEIHPDIQLVFVIGPDALDKSPTASTLAQYEANFGDDRYSFWFGGMKFIVINTSILNHEETFQQQVKAQEAWLSKELENGKLCARGTAVFAFHALYDDETEEDNNRTMGTDALSPETRKKYFELIKNGQSSLLVTAQAPSDQVLSVVSKTESTDAHKCNVICCRSPWSSPSTAVLYVTKVLQAGITIEPLVLESTSHQPASVDTKLPAMPEEAEVVLAAETAQLEMSS